MSTFDRAFIRAYAKDADLRGAAEPAVYHPPQTAAPGGRAVDERDAQPASPRTVDQLYSEGAWYRIELQQSHLAPPHVNPSWFASSPSTPVPPRPAAGAASRSQDALETVDENARQGASESVEPAPTSPPSHEPYPLAHVAPSVELHLHERPTLATFQVMTQFVIASNVALPESPSAGESRTVSPERDVPETAPESSPKPHASAQVAAVPVEADVEPETPPARTAENASPPLQAKADLTPHSTQPSAASSAPANQSVPTVDTKPVAAQASDSAPIHEEPIAEAARETEMSARSEAARLDIPVGKNIPTPHFSLAGRAKTRQQERDRNTGGGDEPPTFTNDGPQSKASFADRPAATATAPPTELKSSVAQSSAAQAGGQLPAVALSAAWEVDAFAWPDLVDRLLRRETKRFMDLAGKLEAAAAEGRNVVTVTSPERNQGRTTLSLCLARRLAANGKRVALVDADFDNPQLAQRLRLNPTCGWQDTVGTDLSLSEAAVASLQDEVTLFPLRVSSVGRSVESLDMADVADVIDHLSRSFDIVLLDMEPVEPLDEPPVESASLHQAVVGLLVYNAASSHEQLAETVLQLRTVGIETIGAVENQAAPVDDL